MVVSDASGIRLITREEDSF